MADGVQSSAESSQSGGQQRAETDSLETRLDRCGLDIPYWTDILRKLGISKGNQVEYLGQKELETLYAFKRFDWEVSALNTFANIDKNYHSYYSEYETLRKRTQEGRNWLENLRRNLTAESVCQDVKKFEEKLQGVLEIPKWVSIDDSSAIKDRIDVYEKILSETEQNLAAYIPPDVSALLQNASGGVLLCGRSYDEKTKCYSNERRQLIQPPEDVSLKQPRLLSESRAFEFESRKQANEFNDSLQKIGGILSLIQSLTNIAIGLESVRYKQSTQNSLQKFFSRSQWHFIPTGSLEFKPVTLKLSDDALKALKKIEKLHTIDGDERQLQAACKEFFANYGTHVYVGIVHLGGEFTLKSTFDSQTKQSMEDIKTLVAMKCDLNCAFNGAASLSLTPVATAKGTHMREGLSTIRSHSDIRGGPKHVSSVQSWKAGLVSDSRTWAIVACESKDPHDYITVCELVQNCAESFEDATRLGNLLFKTLQPEITVELTNPGIDYFNRTMSDLLKLKTNQETTYCDKLMTLNEKMWQCITDFNTTKYWIKIIQENRTVAEMLIKGTQQSLEESERSIVALRLKRLIKPLSIRVFPEKGMVFDWLHNNKVTLEKEKDSKESVAAALVINTIKQSINAAFNNTLSEKGQNEIFAPKRN